MNQPPQSSYARAHAAGREAFRRHLQSSFGSECLTYEKYTQVALHPQVTPTYAAFADVPFYAVYFPCAQAAASAPTTFVAAIALLLGMTF